MEWKFSYLLSVNHSWGGEDVCVNVLSQNSTRKLRLTRDLIPPTSTRLHTEMVHFPFCFLVDKMLEQKWDGQGRTWTPNLTFHRAGKTFLRMEPAISCSCSIKYAEWVNKWVSEGKGSREGLLDQSFTFSFVNVQGENRSLGRTLCETAFLAYILLLQNRMGELGQRLSQIFDSTWQDIHLVWFCQHDFQNCMWLVFLLYSALVIGLTY